MGRLRHLGRALDACSSALARRPALTRAILGVLLVFAWTTAAGAVWFTWDLMASTPKRDMLRRVGDMAQATTLLDLNGRPAFTIFKEQRIEIPLDQGFAESCRRRSSRSKTSGSTIIGASTPSASSAAALANLQEGRRAQGASTLTQQLARQSFLTLDKTSRRKVQEIIVAARARDGVLARTRSSSSTSTRCISATVCTASRRRRCGYFGKHASRPDAGRSGAAGGAGEVAVELRADGEPRARDRSAGPSCCRRWWIGRDRRGSDRRGEDRARRR